MTSKPLRLLFLAALAGLLLPGAGPELLAQIPTTINYQGNLKDNQNNPVNDACMAMKFRIYDNPGGPTSSALWTETHPCVNVVNGQFSVDLGSIVLFSSIPLEFDDQYFLGLTAGAVDIANDDEMTPRRPFTSVGYALHALNAQNADHAQNADAAMNADNAANASNAQNAQNSNRSNKADFAVGAKEDKLALVVMGLRNGDVPSPGSGIYTSPLAAMADLAAWCGVPTSLNRCLVRIMPGIYNLGPSALNMQDWVDIEGSGRNATVLQMAAPVSLADESELRSLGIQFSGGAGPAVSILNDGHVREVTIDVIGSPAAGIDINNGSPVVENVEVVTDVSDPAILIHNNAAPTLRNIRVSVSAGAGEGTGIQITEASPTLNDVTVDGSVSGSQSIIGVSIEATSNPVLSALRVRTEATGGGSTSTAVRIEDSTARITHADLTALIEGAADDSAALMTINSDVQLAGSTLTAGGGACTTCKGVDAQSGAVTRIDGSFLEGALSVRVNSGATSLVGATKLKGPVGGNSASYTCVAVYTETYEALDENCQPIP